MENVDVRMTNDGIWVGFCGKWSTDFRLAFLLENHGSLMENDGLSRWTRWSTTCTASRRWLVSPREYKVHHLKCEVHHFVKRSFTVCFSRRSSLAILAACWVELTRPKAWTTITRLKHAWDTTQHVYFMTTMTFITSVVWTAGGTVSYPGEGMVNQLLSRFFRSKMRKNNGNLPPRQADLLIWTTNDCRAD